MTANWLVGLPTLVDEMLQENLIGKPESDDSGKFLFYLIIIF